MGNNDDFDEEAYKKDEEDYIRQQALERDISKIEERLERLQAQRDLDIALESKVSKAMFKKERHHWATLLVLIGLVTLHWYLTNQWSEARFKDLKEQVENYQKPRNPNSPKPATVFSIPNNMNLEELSNDEK